MNALTRTRAASVLAAGAIGILALSGCSSGGDSDMTTQETQSSSSDSEQSPAPADDSGGMAAGADLVGPGCAAYAEQNPTGGGSVEGMAQDPVATAASNNPMLSTLVKAVSGELNPDVNLVDTLNGDEFTVIAPVDDAFAAVPKKDLDALAKDSDMLTKVLTYHVIPGQISPADIPGKHETVEGAEVNVTGSGDNLKFDDAKLVCGGVKTANATVYMVDAVMMPPK